ncbi:hypothetical protein LWM38_16115 [Vibrio kanaloae]|uniref:delta-class carbonic anhydrase n=1 Tax=Vibrio kanaloae TaxID=170673 RepID=UPI001EEE7091|nr:delta-class carbonic anhydrase [Vibrio kanaloae]UIJ43166.1 hypothetical protein LWM38_16115 [Vibrio kanaloae]
MKSRSVFLSVVMAILSGQASASNANHEPVSDSVIAEQRLQLSENTQGKGFGPQAPRDLGSFEGTNAHLFSDAPDSAAMNLCNIHFHKNAEHKGGEFTQYVGNGDGKGFQSGYKYEGKLSTNELKSFSQKVCPSEHGSLYSGDTIEVHYVYSTAQVAPGETLAACFNDAITNPQLRVETQVYVLVNDDKALDFETLAKHTKVDGLHQAPNIPKDTGTAIQYSGSTSGPSYNEQGSPFQVTWNVRPQVAKVNIATVGRWCEGNDFNEDHAHGVRNLVVNPDLLSPIRN